MSGFDSENILHINSFTSSTTNTDHMKWHGLILQNIQETP